ncbi:hypothetical protein M413DRAFT_7868 [Hebeloma cylindrosporum]|uniref:Uncharacterized protein n=1 Tax=Hebeloma cylindrosporum TaxID=76867 RepID=A0A0C3CU10_HEBCY|nr:hypothetical protein M413DRAFT_7868 [Hebeloma cylindrosporum h7]
MANLFREYGTERESGPSTSRVVVSIATKPNLSQDDVVDTKTWNPNAFTRYRLRDDEHEKAQQTITELQIFIQQMAKLILERTTYFIVDPDDNASRLLEGSQTPAQLQAAWTMLSKCMEAAQHFILKYQEEYKGGIVPTSPASTKPELHEELGNLDNNSEKLRFAYAEFPRHSVVHSSADKREIKTDRNWEYIVTLPAWMREMLDNQSSYDDRRTISSVGDTTERRQLPENEVYECSRSEERWVAFAHPEPQPNPSMVAIPLLGTGTPFRSQTTFFQTEKGQPIEPFPKHKSDKHSEGGNLLHGLATPSGPTSFHTPRFDPGSASTPWIGHAPYSSSIWGPPRKGASGTSNANWRAPSNKTPLRREEFIRDLPPHVINHQLLS